MISMFNIRKSLIIEIWNNVQHDVNRIMLKHLSHENYYISNTKVATWAIYNISLLTGVLDRLWYPIFIIPFISHKIMRETNQYLFHNNFQHSTLFFFCVSPNYFAQQSSLLIVFQAFAFFENFCCLLPSCHSIVEKDIFWWNHCNINTPAIKIQLSS